jgi:replicative DNA helicase
MTEAFATPKRRKSGERDRERDRMLDAIKEPPHSLEAEQAVIGGLLLDNLAWDRVSDRVSESDFYRHDHRLLFRAITNLARANQPFDFVTLKENLKAQGELENAGGEFYLYELAQNTPSAANIGAYADIVRERSIFRQLIGVSTEIAENAYRPEGRKASEVLDEAEQKVFSIGEQMSRGSGPVAIGELLAKAVDRVEYLYHTPDALTGVPTGFTDFDDMTAGLQPADMVIIAGRPSMGKTTFAMNIGEYVAYKEQKPVLIFSMEMPGESLAMRMLSSMSSIDQGKIKTGRLDDHDFHRLASTLTMMSNTPMYIDDTPALTPNEMRARARRLAKQFDGKLGLIILDYLQLMQVPGLRDNRVAEISEISRSIKTVAKELNVPIIALSQLNRSLEQRADKRPVMSDLRESGAIEQDADLIVFIYRDEVYYEDSRDKGTAEIIIAKHRNGPTGKVRLTFLGQYTRFANFTPNMG